MYLNFSVEQYINTFEKVHLSCRTVVDAGFWRATLTFNLTSTHTVGPTTAAVLLWTELVSILFWKECAAVYSYRISNFFKASVQSKFKKMYFLSLNKSYLWLSMFFFLPGLLSVIVSHHSSAVNLSRIWRNALKAPNIYLWRTQPLCLFSPTTKSVCWSVYSSGKRVNRLLQWFHIIA